MPLDQIDVDQIDVDQEEKSAGKEMSFLDHLEELRWHIIRSLAAISIFGITLFIYQDWMFKVLIFGPSRQDFITYRLLCNFSKRLGMGDAMCFAAPKVNLQTIGFAEPFVTSMWVSFVVGLILAAPYVLWEIWRFVSPGLLPKERRVATGAVGICSFLFLLGVAFGYFFMAPFAIRFLIGYTIPGVENIPTLNSYINYMVMFTLPIGLVFELPVVVYFFARIGLITADDMRAYRRHAIVVILVLAGIITPPDVVSQLLVTIPLYSLYEISIIIAKRVAPKEDEEEGKLLTPKIKGGRFRNLRLFAARFRRVPATPKQQEVQAQTPTVVQQQDAQVQTPTVVQQQDAQVQTPTQIQDQEPETPTEKAPEDDTPKVDDEENNQS